MPTYVHPSLLWGLPLVGVPLLIHLINMLRHRRVPWAAMEFLLASQKRNRSRVLLRQLLLLLARMLAIAAVVLVLAQPVLENRWGGLVGSGNTHHVVLLDDSFSMSDRWDDTDAFTQAKHVAERIGTQAERRTGRQTFTLLRFSQADAPDLGAEPVRSDFAERLRAALEPIRASQTDAGPLPALEAIAQRLDESEGERSVVYLVSDFRARQWRAQADLRNHLAEIAARGARLHLVDCVEAARPNLAITGLAPAEGTRAVGVPLFVEVTVKNFTDAVAADVPVLLQADGDVLPAVKIPRIPPGEAATERFPVNFATAGEHAITARLETDPVAADNLRYCVIDFPVDVPVLLIDGDPQALDGQYLSAALAPGGPAPTGIRPRIETPRYLSLHPLDPYRAVYLLNVDRLDDLALGAVEAFVRSGGGVGVFLGDRCRSKFVNDALYRDGKGFFPAPLRGEAELLLDRLRSAPDLEVSDHPIFRVFGGRRNSFLTTVKVARYFALPEDWEPEPDSATRVIARLRNGAPLVIERDYGDGRVVAFLTTAAPAWNNWARNNPSYVVAMLELQAHLARRPGGDASRPVGTPIELELDPAEYDRAVRFAPPGEAPEPVALEAVAAGDGSLRVVLPGAEQAGVCEVSLARKDGTREVRRYAFNVEAEEGDLARLAGPDLAERLEGVPYEYRQAASFEYAAEELAGFNLSEPLLFALVLLLIGEQVLAWSASYHPARRRPAAKGGAR